MPLTDMCLIIIEQSVAYLLVKESCITIKTLHHHIDETIPDTRIPASSNGITFDLRIPTLFNDILTTLHQFETQYRKSPNYIEINEQE